VKSVSDKLANSPTSVVIYDQENYLYVGREYDKDVLKVTSLLVEYREILVFADVGVKQA
jgi:hypothetical protein